MGRISTEHWWRLTRSLLHLEHGVDGAIEQSVPQLQLQTLRQPSVICVCVDLGTSMLGLVWVGALQVVPDKARHEKMHPVEMSHVCRREQKHQPPNNSSPETHFLVKYEEELLAKCLHINDSPAYKLLQVDALFGPCVCNRALH